jgi:hypothetical protein
MTEVVGVEGEGEKGCTAMRSAVVAAVLTRFDTAAMAALANVLPSATIPYAGPRAILPPCSMKTSAVQMNFFLTGVELDFRMPGSGTGVEVQTYVHFAFLEQSGF